MGCVAFESNIHGYAPPLPVPTLAARWPQALRFVMMRRIQLELAASTISSLRS